jgi:glycosyltransferase involved in cell wall biosynthesis
VSITALTHVSSRHHLCHIFIEDNMKVSVITATYNRAPTIVRAISSIKSQTYSDVQVVVIDGASEDSTVPLVSNFLSRDDVLLSEPDNGIYDALNKGLDLASGEIIAFLHSDDRYFDDDVISTVMKYFEDDSVDVVYGNVCFFSGENVEKVVRTYHSDVLSLKNLAWGKMPAHPAMFIRSRVYEKIGGFKTDYRIAADYEFLCRLVKSPGLTATYHPGTLVQMELGGVSTSGIKNTIILNKEVYRAVRTNGIYTNIFMLLSKYPSKIRQFLKK